MRRKTKALVLVIATGLFTSAARLSYGFIRIQHVERTFHKVKVGQSRADVVHLLGDPNYHQGACGKIAKPPNGCVEEFVYAPPLAPWIPDYYVVSFTRDDRVTAAEHYTSP